MMFSLWMCFGNPGTTHIDYSNDRSIDFEARCGLPNGRQREGPPIDPEASPSILHDEDRRPTMARQSRPTEREQWTLDRRRKVSQ
jgi:hypothetical protein